MKKLSQNEGIAVVVALATVVVFLPAIFTATTTLDNHIGTSAETLSGDAAHYLTEQTLKDFEVTDIVSGDGATATFGDTIYIHYVGTLSDGTVFDTSTGNDEPYSFVLGEGEVITGWDLGLVGMREGGTRHLMIPAALAYGKQELTDIDGNVVIPSGSTLLFDVILVHVEKAPAEE